MSLTAPTADDLETLARVVGPRHVLTGEAAAPWLAEPRGLYPGRAAAVLKPGSTAEVAAIVAHARDRRLGIVPYGGGTGLVGGQTLADGPPALVLSLERLDRVRAVLPADQAIVAEAGVVLADLHRAAEAKDRIFPLRLASEGSSRVGGILATNAGGTAVLRYGNARDLCLGIEAVLPDSSVLHGLTSLRKNNTGYDLRHLLIGAEGTLGIITAATLRLFPRPGEQVTAMLAVPDPAAAVALLELLRPRFDAAITGFELIARQGIDWVRAFWPDAADPLSGRPDWRVLLELGGPAGSGLAPRAEDALADALARGLATDGALARSEAQRAAMWRPRELIPEANRRVGAIASHDISVPIGRLAAFVSAACGVVARIGPGLRVNCFGHVGDGNLHFNVFPPDGAGRDAWRNRADAIRRTVHDCVAAHDGSISAEHGIGRAKRDELVRHADPAKLAAMRAIKRALDPAGIMNPGAVLAAGP